MIKRNYFQWKRMYNKIQMTTIKYDDHIFFFAHTDITFITLRFFLCMGNNVQKFVLIIIERYYLVNVYLMLYDELDDYVACVLVLLDIFVIIC